MRPLACLSAPGVAALVVAATSLAGCMSTSTYGTGEAPEMAIVREMTGGLAGGKKQAKVEYQPRAPLVMPASAASLPAPVQTASAANPQWPVDPDQTVEGPKQVDESTGAVSPDEYRRLKPLAGLGSKAPSRPLQNERDWSHGVPMQKDQRQEFKAALDERAGFGTGKRRFLTEPPESFRAPAPTAQSEFEEIEKERGNFVTRLFPGDD